ncbi:MAG: D-alanine--D-alanine ligase [Porticoccaceae bacterium]|nr:D-alanine--D-alanine ligase [Porticoccaceae bacterium]
MIDNTVGAKAAMAARFGKVAVLYGGTSAEREVSLNSGTQVLKALLAGGVDAVGIDAGPSLVADLTALAPDRVFIVLHGPGGEDGTLQGALEFLGLPYTGSGVLASALAMDKMRTKLLWKGLGLPTADFASLNASSDWAAVLADLGGVAMVKPSREGSSIGMARAASAAELESAWRVAAALGDEVIAEAWLAGAEYTVAILDGEALPPIKLETERGFYDYEAKYLRDDTRYLCPCGLPAEREEALKALALAAFDSLGCGGWGRVDVMLDDSGNFQLLEVNTVPGMTDHSLVPMAAKARGIDFETLVLRILDTAGAAAQVQVAPVMPAAASEGGQA